MELRSTQFRKEREATWRRLEQLLGKIDRHGLHGLEPAELSKLPSLYRSTISSLNVARAISLDRNLVLYLENLAQRAFLCVYGSRRPVREALTSFFLRDWPQSIRRFRWHLLVSTLFLMLGAGVGYALTLADPVQFHTFVDPGLAAGRGPEASDETLRHMLYDDGSDETADLGYFSSFLFTHNARVGLLMFAVGFVAGIPAVILLISNGLMLGAFTALYVSRGLAFPFFGWLLPHGVTEILALLICGAGGLALGQGVLFPGPTTRVRNLAATGRATAPLLLGAVLMLMAAGVLEGVFRQRVTNDITRYAVVTITAVLWATYFLFAGRREATP